MSSMEIRKMTKEERDRLRRADIVQAAMDCVISHGFHKTTTAMIARAAGFSEGQLYRYFESKEAIIGAIAETMTLKQMERIIAAKDSRELAEIISRDMIEDSEERTKERVIFLEMQAEATRNPVVAEILKKSDDRLKAKSIKSLLGEFPQLSRAEAEGIAEYIATISEGRIVRAAKTDSNTTSRFLSIYKTAVSFLLSGRLALKNGEE